MVQSPCYTVDRAFERSRVYLVGVIVPPLPRQAEARNLHKEEISRYDHVSSYSAAGCVEIIIAVDSTIRQH
jgi:hypothetical protein